MESNVYVGGSADLCGPYFTDQAYRITQLIFFDQPDGGSSPQEKQIRNDPVAEEIIGLDLDSMTPREALNKLAEYQGILRGRDADP